jgi:hypothetical protein
MSAGDRPDSLDEYLRVNLAEARRILRHQLGGAQIGLTGSLKLRARGRRLQEFHDIDLVFTADLMTNLAIIGELSRITRSEKSARVYEHGKGWQIRVRSTTGLLCAFFAYQDPRDSPLHGLREIRTIRDELVIRGTVTDHVHNGYLPTILTVNPRNAVKYLPISERSDLTVIISHLRGRGDFFEGDEGLFRGALVEIETGKSSFLALSVIDGDDSRILTPPWIPY